jgi:hypothetical protein
MMQEFTLTVVSKTGHAHDYVVYAPTVDDAVEKMLEKISYDVLEVHTEDHTYIV